MSSAAGSPETAAEQAAPSAVAVSGRDVMSGGLWSVIGRTLPFAYTFVVSIAAARILGPGVMGQLALITFASASITMLLTASLATAVFRYVGEALGRGDTGAVRLLAAWVWRVCIALAVATVCLFGVFALVAHAHRLAWFLAGFWSAGTLLNTPPSVVLGGAGRWRDANIVGLLTGVIHAAIAVAVLLAGGGITALVAVDAVVSLANVAGTEAFARRFLRRLAPASAESADLRAPVKAYALGTAPAVVLSFVIERRSELVLLALLATSTQVAIFSLPFSGLLILALVPSAIGAVTSTAFATLLGSGESARIRDASARALRLALVAAIPLTALSLAVGPTGMRLVYGHAYAGTGEVLLALVAGLPLIVVTALQVASLQGLGRIRAQLVVYGVAAVANVVLNLVLIPSFDAVGAGVAHSLAYVVAATLATLAVRKEIGMTLPAPRTLAPMAAASIAGALVAAACVVGLHGAAGFATGAVAGTAVLVGCARLLRVLPREDATWLAGHFGSGAAARLVLAVASGSRA